MLWPFDLAVALQLDLARDNKRFRLENPVLKDERDIGNNGYPILRASVAVRFKQTICDIS